MTVKILQFGTTGQLGVELLRQAPAHDVAITALGRGDCDLADPAAAARKVEELRPDVVVIAAAYTAVDLAESEQDAAHAVNAATPGAIAAAAAKVGAALINVSTDYVFDGEGGAPYAEDAATNPLNTYGRTKLEGEKAVAAANPRSLSIRTSWVVSPHGKNFVKTMLRVAAAGNPLKVVDDQSGRPTSAADLAGFILGLAETLAAAPAGDRRFGIVHFANDGEVTWRDFAVEIFRQALGDAAPEVGAQKTADYVTPAKRPLRATMDLTRLNRDFGVSPRAWQTALKDIIAELKAAD
ncbi:dTDP-4-dehydrorhamnose reductase [Phenylobacterium kunshanense]|uniref:dTDP-4-dehydrorhamnose reductase n=1 Tax=Phenylobacterium kunshanense TaxID=1445034 RepID=A0A328B8R9_9CAUL|nr:dTDP-4-dehydrorhamnose reductase [Phenylobacterium kunshanense]RAK63347.1 dTDP-4-dehydrorhamnose reductase [Phenylobacterium kunshanense]